MYYQNHFKPLTCLLMILILVNISYSIDNPETASTVEETMAGWLEITSGVTVSPSTVQQGNNFQVSYTIKEVNGEAITLSALTCAILDANGNHLFDHGTIYNKYIAAYGMYTFTASFYTHSGHLSNPGTYKAEARGQVGSTWFTFQTGVNPRSFTVLASIPDITVNPTSFTETMTTGDYIVEQVTVGNSGNATLTISNITVEVDNGPMWLGNLSRTSGSVSPGSSLSFQFNVNAVNLSAGSYSGRVKIYCNDPDENPKNIPVNITVGSQLIPIVSVNKATIRPGETIIESGKGFTPNGLAELHVIHPNGFHWGENNDKTVVVDNYGCFAVPWITDENTVLGTYRYWAIDRKSGKQAPEVTFQVLEHQEDIGSIRGGISDDINRTPLTNARVFLFFQGSVIDEQDVHPISAEYFFENLPVGFYTVEVQAPGYENKTRTIQVINDQISEGNITLKKTGSADDNIAEFTSKSLSNNTNVQGGKPIQQVFTFRNTGGNTWRYYSLRLIDGNAMGAGTSIDITETRPGQHCTIPVNIIPPSSGGHYISTWQLNTSDNKLFGPQVTIDIVVTAPQLKDDAIFVRNSNSGRIQNVRPKEERASFWLVNNTGTTLWDQYTLECVSGCNSIKFSKNAYNVAKTSPGEIQLVGIGYSAPEQSGLYSSEWQLRNKSGSFFGEKLLLEIFVSPPGEETVSEGNGSGSESNPNGASSSEPVNLANGNYYYEHVDLQFTGPLGTLFKRTYNAQDDYDGPLGYNWTHNFNTMLAPSENGPTLLRTGDGRATYFKKLGDYDFEAISRVSEALKKNRNGSYTFTYKNGNKQHFSSQGNLISLEDRNGRITSCSYSDDGKLQKITDPAGRSLYFSYDNFQRLGAISDGSRTVNYVYDTAGDLVAVSDALGYRTEFVYSHHRLIKIIDPKGETIVENTYDNSRKCILQKDPLGYETTFNYDIENGVTTETDPRGFSTEYTFESMNRLVKIVDPLGYTETYEYDENDNRITVTDRNGNATKFEFNDFGQAITKTDALGYVTRYEYDENGNLVNINDDMGSIQEFTYNHQKLPVMIKDAKGSITSCEYDSYGNLVTKETDGSSWQFAYDMLGRKITMLDPLGNGSSYEYDALNHIVKTTEERGYSTRYEFDENGNKVAMIDPNGNKVSYLSNNRDELIRTIDQIGGVTEYAYDEVGNKIEITDALGNKTQFIFNGSKQLIEKINPLFYKTKFTYDGNGNKLSETNARGNTGYFIYDKIDRLIKTVDPLGNNTEYFHDARGRVIKTVDANGNMGRYSYDGAGNIISETDALGNSTTFTYDARNNRLEVMNPMGGKAANQYDAKNQLISTTDFTGRHEKYSYDSAGNLISRIDYMGYIEQYEYDANNNRTASIDAGGSQVNYTYTDNNLMESVSDALGNTTTYKYDALGRKIESVDANGNSTSYQYNSNGKLTLVANANNAMTRYDYDAVDNLIRITDAKNQQTNFQYDAINRKIKQVTPLNFEYQFSYDAIGNKINELTPNGYSIAFSYYPNNQLKNILYPDNSVRYTYNENGLPIEIQDNSGTIKREYDASNRLLKEITLHGTINYNYDGPNRIRMTYPDGKILSYAYSNNRLVNITDWSQRSTLYSYSPSGLIEKIIYPNGNQIEYQYDAANRLLEVRNIEQNGETIKNFEYQLDAVGNRTHVIKKGRGAFQVEHLTPGSNIYKTAAELSRRFFPEGNREFILGSGINPVDLLTLAPFVYKTNRSILFSDPHNLDRSSETKAEIERLVNGQLDPKGIIIGGVHSISDDIDMQLTEISISPERLGSQDRFDMAKTIASLSQTVIGDTGNSDYQNYAIIVNGMDEQGAIAAAAFSAKFNVPILLTKQNTVPEATQIALNELGIKHTILVGNNLDSQIKTWLDEHGYSVMTHLQSVSPIINQVGLWNYAGYYNYDTLYLVDQANYLKVLAATALASRENSILLLADGKEIDITTKNFLAKSDQNIKRVCTIGNEVQFFNNFISGISLFVADQDTVCYSYDKLNQLIDENTSNGDHIQYSYDAVGNRLTKKTNDRVIEYTYDAENRLKRAGNTTFEFDKNGNRIKKATGNEETVYSYNSQNSLISVVLPNGAENNFEYDGAGRRIQKIDSEGVCNYVYDLTDLALVKCKANSTGKYYVTGLGIDDWLYTVTNKKATYFQKDGLSSIIGLTDSTGQVEQEIRYDGFGNLQADATELKESISFTGRELDKDTGLYFYRSRFYDSKCGVFLNKDVYQGEYDNPLSMHRFCYVGNNPVNFVDAFGYCPESKWEFNDFLFEYTYNDLFWDEFELATELSLTNLRNMILKGASLRPFGTSLQIYNEELKFLSKMRDKFALLSLITGTIEEFNDKEITLTSAIEGWKNLPQNWSESTTDEKLYAISEFTSSLTSVFINAVVPVDATLGVASGGRLGFSGEDVMATSEWIVETTKLDEAIYQIGKRFGWFY